MGHSNRGVTLHILTTDPQPPDNLVVVVAVPECDGSMLCDCEPCDRERAFRVKRGVRTTPQPWSGAKRAA